MKRQIITFMTVMYVMGALAQNVNGDERQYIDFPATPQQGIAGKIIIS